MRFAKLVCNTQYSPGLMLSAFWMICFGTIFHSRFLTLLLPLEPAFGHVVQDISFFSLVFIWSRRREQNQKGAAPASRV